MDGVFGARRRTRRPIINITSLIDVMFLLLIFFMVSSTFRQSVGIDIELPRAQTAEEQQQSVYNIFITADGDITWSAPNTPSASQPTVLSQDELRVRLRTVVEEAPDAPIILSADEAVPYQKAFGVIDVAREVGATKLVLATDYGQGGTARAPLE